MSPVTEQNNSELLIYQNQDGLIKINVLLENETVWLTQAQMAELFDKAKSIITEHIKNIFSNAEFLKAEVIKKFGISEFQQKTANDDRRISCLYLSSFSCKKLDKYYFSP